MTRGFCPHGYVTPNDVCIDCIRTERDVAQARVLSFERQLRCRSSDFEWPQEAWDALHEALGGRPILTAMPELRKILETLKPFVRTALEAQNVARLLTGRQHVCGMVVSVDDDLDRYCNDPAVGITEDDVPVCAKHAEGIRAEGIRVDELPREDS